MKKWKQIVARCLPGSFAGITLGTWLRILYENRFSIDPPYWARAAAITLSSVPNTALGWCESLLHARAIRATKIDPPIFVLGVWRSGTTHLHNLLTQDPRFAYPNFYQVVFPRTFLLTERLGSKIVGRTLPKTRGADNVKFGVREPQEDEFALISLTGQSFLVGLAFPRRAAAYDRFITLGDLSPAELEQWKAALLWFIRKLAYKHGRPIVLKSPGHTCRIRTLLDLFPRAKFVHIHRNPYAVFQSSRHFVESSRPWWTLQRQASSRGVDQSLRMYKQVFEKFFAERDLIPAGHFYDLAYEDLEHDPIGQMRKVYEALDLPDFADAEPQLRQYTSSLAGYKKNRLPELPPELRERIATEWQCAFEEWGYAR